MLFAVALVAVACLSLDQQLTHDEGLRLTPYRDQKGHWTVGVGHYLSAQERIRYSPGISLATAQRLLARDITAARADLLRYQPWVVTLDATRRDVLVNMTFNLGIGGVNHFRRLLMAVKAGHYDTAAKEMRASHWYRDVGRRARRLTEEMRSGSRCLP